MQANIEERVKKIIREQMAIYGATPDVIGSDYRLADDAGFDSLDLVEVAIGLEGEFDTEIEDSAVWSFTTVQSVIDTVQKALGGQHANA
jgi:acyl carrier protein